MQTYSDYYFWYFSIFSFFLFSSAPIQTIVEGIVARWFNFAVALYTAKTTEPVWLELREFTEYKQYKLLETSPAILCTHRVEEGHHYLDFRLTLDLVRQNILVSEECWAVEIKEEPNNDDVDNHKSTIETDFFSDT